MSVVLGGRYVDRNGQEYTVTGVVGSRVKIVYLKSKGVALISSLTHSVAQRRVEEEQTRDRRFSRRAIQVRSMRIDLYTLGFLVSRGYLFANMPPQYENDFVDLYHKLANENPKHYSVTAEHIDKWAISTQVNFGGTQNEIDALDFGELEIHQARIKDEKRWGIYSNDFYWVLISLGFRSGRGNHDLPKIRSQLHVSHKSIGEFERGLGDGRKRQ